MNRNEYIALCSIKIVESFCADDPDLMDIYHEEGSRRIKKLIVDQTKIAIVCADALEEANVAPWAHGGN